MTTPVHHSRGRLGGLRTLLGSLRGREGALDTPQRSGAGGRGPRWVVELGRSCEVGNVLTRRWLRPRRRCRPWWASGVRVGGYLLEPRRNRTWDLREAAARASSQGSRVTRPVAPPSSRQGCRTGTTDALHKPLPRRAGRPTRADA